MAGRLSQRTGNRAQRTATCEPRTANKRISEQRISERIRRTHDSLTSPCDNASGRIVDSNISKADRALSALLDSGAHALCLVAPDGRIVFASSSTRDILGYEPDELIGRGFHELVPPDQRRTVLKTWARVRRSEIEHSTSVRCFHKDGGERMVEARATTCREAPIGGTGRQPPAGPPPPAP